MLHILLLILKIIGIILAVILGLLLLIICVVLFVPISYQGSAKCEGKLDTLAAIIKVKWLFRLIQVNVKYEDNNLKYCIQIAWKKIVGGMKHEKKEPVEKQEADPEEVEKEPSKNQEISEMAEKCEEVEQCSQEKTPKESELSERLEEEPQKIEEEREEKSEEKIGFIKKIQNKIQAIKEKVKNLLEKINCTIKNICDKLKMLLEKKDKVMGFLKDKNHKKAFVKIKKELFKLLKRLIPKQFIVKAKFGFEDPSLTGKVLAGLSILYPFADEHMEIIPVFDDKVIDGRITVKGRIFIIHFVCLAWNLFWCKQVRLLYKDIRNFKL